MHFVWIYRDPATLGGGRCNVERTHICVTDLLVPITKYGKIVFASPNVSTQIRVV